MAVRFSIGHCLKVEMKMALSFLILIITSGCVASINKAAPKTTAANHSEFTPAISEEVNSGIIKLENIISGIEWNQPIGRDLIDRNLGMPCTETPELQSIVWSRLGVGMAHEMLPPEYILNNLAPDSFYDTFKKNGYNTDKNSGGLFKKYERSSGVDFAIGGEITLIRMDVCRHRSAWNSALLGQTGNMELEVSWKLFSILEKKVVYEIKTKGTASVEEPSYRAIRDMFTSTFQMASQQLADNPDFIKRVTQEASITKPDNGPDPLLTIKGRKPYKGGISTNISMVRNATVVLDTGSGHGSGFVISESGHILTNAHVVGSKKKLRVSFLNGLSMVGTVLRVNNDLDVALLEIENAITKPIPINKTPLNITEDVYAVGAPIAKSNEGTVTKGVVSKFIYRGDGIRIIQSDVSVHGGESGGPLVDKSGNVVGITFAGLHMQSQKRSSGLNLFIPIADALDAVNIDVRGQ
jgi:serine protease Do